MVGDAEKIVGYPMQANLQPAQEAVMYIVQIASEKGRVSSCLPTKVGEL